MVLAKKREVGLEKKSKLPVRREAGVSRRVWMSVGT
jgi:hypothetical protein